MKLLNRILIFVTVFLLCLTIISCGEDESCTHVDADADGACDICGGDTPLPDGAINIVKGGVPVFQFVLGGEPSDEITDAIMELADELSARLASEVKVVNDYKGNMCDAEIIVGAAKNRGEKYDIDARVLGYDGYAVRFIDGKILLLGGSDDALKRAIEHLAYKLTVASDEQIRTITLYSTDGAECPTTDFDVDSVTIAGQPLSEFVIATDTSQTKQMATAEYAADLIYKRAGVPIDIIDISNLDDGTPAITIEILSHGDERTTDEGFRIFTDEDGCLRIQTEFPEKLHENATAFIYNTLLNHGVGTVEIPSDFDYRKDVRRIYYSEFNAVGDGKTDDYAAIRDAHDYANIHGHIVCADAGCSYYIGSIVTSIRIRTDVEWGDATFIIDDSKVTQAYKNVYIFTVAPDKDADKYNYQSITVGDAFTLLNDNGGIRRDSFAKFDLGLGYPALIKLVNSNHKNYIRYGSNANSGTEQSEIILVDAEGNISPDTPLLFDYEFLTSAVVYKIDERKVTLSGGRFITIANDQPIETGYYARGISITRSGTTVRNLIHEITKEGDTGAPYIAFLSISCASDVTIEYCTVQGRKNYGYMGSYDITVDTANDVVFKNVVQSNFFLEDGKTTSITGSAYWGIMGSNHCKNVVYDRCRLTRFDAHCGLYNGKIINSEIAAINLTGGGDMLIEGSTMYIGTASALITLRSDYGSTWHGSVTIKDLTVIRSKTSSSLNVFSAAWNNHDFGYRTYMPTTVTVDNISCNGLKTLNLVTGTASSLNYILDSEVAGKKNLNPYTVTEKFIIRNCAGITVSIPSTTPFKQTQIIKE